MNSTTLICKRCKAPLEYEEGSAVLRCPHCGYTEKLDESDNVTRERIRAKAYTEAELGKAKIETDANIKVKELHIEEKKLVIKKANYVIGAVVVVVIAALIGIAVYNGQHKGKIRIKQTSDAYIGMDYQVAHRLLAEAGFENIEEAPQATLLKKEQDLVGKVVRVSIDGNPAFEKGWFSKGASVTIYYGVLDPKHANDIRMPLFRTDCIGTNYQTVVEKLTEEGFHNIKLVPYADLTMDRKEQDGRITRISINNSEEFYSGDYYAADSIIQIDYHTLDPDRLADVKTPTGYDSFANAEYAAVCREFLSAGFTNITLIPKYDVGFFDGAKNGIVQSVSVNGENTFLEGVWYPYDTEVKIAFRTKEPEYLEKNYQEISKALSSVGFTSIELKALNDLEVSELKKSGQITSIQIGGKELSEAEELNLLSPITIEYHSERQAGTDQVKVTIASKDLQGLQYEEVVTALEEMGFSNITATALEDLSNEILHKNGDVSKISIGDLNKFAVGDILEKSAEAVVSYHSLKPVPTSTPEPELNDGQVRITVAPKELKGKDYQEVIFMFQEMGFTNISENPLGDLKKGWLYDDGEVKEVLIADSAKFSLNDIFDKDAEIIISYHSFPSEQ